MVAWRCQPAPAKSSRNPRRVPAAGKLDPDAVRVPLEYERLVTTGTIRPVDIPLCYALFPGTCYGTQGLQKRMESLALNPADV
jgi:hypothetical protein